VIETRRGERHPADREPVVRLSDWTGVGGPHGWDGGDYNKLWLKTEGERVKLSLRLRYEVRRELAPYLGVVWSRRFGGTAGLVRAVGAGSAGCAAPRGRADLVLS
jgi:Copper resistance protein B precursor (CopB)